MPHKPRHPRGGTDYRFKIDAYTPETIPMARLAMYMRELSQLLGEEGSVHFRRLEPGSTVMVHRIEKEAVPKVRERVAGVRQGDGVREAMRAYKTINKYLSDDNAVAVLQEKKGSAEIIRFPGREEAEEKFAAVRQHGSIDGIVTRVGGSDATVPIWLEAEGTLLTGCYATRSIAKDLGAKMFEPVRLHGRGRWTRDSEGAWSLIDFKIESFEALDDAPLSNAIEAMRAIPSDWAEKGFEELEAIRRGPRVKGNGGH